MNKYKTILVEKQRPVGKIVYNVPEKRNPLTIEMIDEATKAFLKFEEEDEVRAIILTHTGPIFSSGMPQHFVVGKEYEEIMKMSHKYMEYQSFLQRDISKPVIAAAYGPGPIDGMDIVIFSESASFNLPAINIGLL
ncbi:MAG: enoyl-CoA hydratase/isomerase family protein [Deltaproteobacteria bacterium]|nr:enoyl-CoA hydratase/isomerase family protein [Deltaproteobacteria bacterium]